MPTTAPDGLWEFTPCLPHDPPEDQGLPCAGHCQAGSHLAAPGARH